MLLFQTATHRHGKIEVARSPYDAAVDEPGTASMVVTVGDQIVADFHPHGLEFGTFTPEENELHARNEAIHYAQDLRARLDAS